MKNYKDFAAEQPQKVSEKRKIIAVKNKIVINPDFGSYQAKTHDNSDTSVPLDNPRTDKQINSGLI